MHVFQLLLQLFLAPHIEIVESPLPKMRLFPSIALEGKRQLSIRHSSSLLQQRPRDFLFQHLQNLRRISLSWLTDQQMYMFGHHHIPDQPELMSAANFIQDFHKPVSLASRSEQRLPPVTTEGDKMKIALPVMPLECIAHRTKPAPLKPKGAAPRLSPSANCRSGMLVQCAPLKKKKTSLRHPPSRSGNLAS